jgi:uncharacterized protein YjbI with pentapeptide repeats
MRSQRIEAANSDSVVWDENYFKFCDFEGFSVEGGVVGSDFIGCTFRDVEWYWGMFPLANFIACRLVNCTFRGTSFRDARFVECLIDRCLFVKDNLDGECEFAGAIAYGCQVRESAGFGAVHVGPRE